MMYFLRRLLSLIFLFASVGILYAQQVPFGINYQAVARNPNGNEISSQDIDVRFSILSGSPEGVLEYQEVHNMVRTSRYGVFSLVIGTGNPVGGEKETFDEITWEMDPHFLKVEIKFNSDYLQVGTMQFKSVPYALYAARSLEPGPQGPQGPAGDPASDDQTLSFDGENLEISGGNVVNLEALANDPTDEIQYLSLKGDSLGITNGNYIKLQEINIDDADADPTNEMQTLSFNSVDSKLTITEGNDVDLSPLNNTDNQQLEYNASTRELSITNGSAPINLGELKNDADASTSNEIITSMSIVGSSLVINEGGSQHSVDLSSNLVAFRAKKTTPADASTPLSNVDFLPDDLDYNDGSAFNLAAGEFTVPIDGIYTFDINYTSGGTGVELSIYKNGIPYEKLASNLSFTQQIHRNKTYKLIAGDRIKLSVYTGTGLAIGTGVFSGFRLY